MAETHLQSEMAWRIQENIFHYRNFTILKDQALGHGSYGAVYKARCDQLVCAAKVLHPTIVDPYDPGSGRILQRFQQECDFLNHIRHPHIVQYLGVCRDPESNLPVLLMELLDESLTKMLERSVHPISYHVEVDLCHDVSLAVSYLHSNGIIHRDLSGNNVLVIAGRRAKVTDFGMSKLVGSGRHMTPLTFCPGTLGYMSPESLIEPPRYTEKLDVFSQGVIMIQVCTRQFPDPRPAMKAVEDSRSPVGMIQMPVPEPERRKKHIDLIDPTHPLLPIATGCLEYKEKDRPSAEELCQRLVALKENPEYIESSQHMTPATSEVNTLQQRRDELARQVELKDQQITEKDEELTTKNQQILSIGRDNNRLRMQVSAKEKENKQLQMQLQELNQRLVANEQVTAEFQETNQQLHRQIGDLQTQIEDLQRQLKLKPEPPKEIEFKWKDGGEAERDELARQLEEKDREISAKDQQIADKDRLQTQLQMLNKRLVANEQEFQKTNQQLHRQIRDLHMRNEDLQRQLKPKPELTKEIAFKWKDGKEILHTSSVLGSSVVVGNVAYFSCMYTVHSYDTSTGRWGTLTECPQMYGSLAVIQGFLTMVGGRFFEITSNLVSHADYAWVKKFPPMPTRRKDTSASTYQHNLIVAGGTSSTGAILATVEVLNTETLVWSTPATLPRPNAYASTTICGDRLYMLGGNDTKGECQSVFSCSLSELLRTRSASLFKFNKLRQSQVWQCDTDIPVYRSTGATVHGELVAVGGQDKDKKKTTAVYKYDPNTRSWNVISHMKTARSECLVAVMNTNQMIVVLFRVEIAEF